MTTIVDGPVMFTSTGRYVSPLYPWDWEPDIQEIAHHLSGIARFLGATRVPYTVAEHSVRVSDLLPDGLKLDGLLHDSPEAYAGDWPTYLKHHPLIGQGYRSVEAALAARFEDFFGCDFDSDLVHWADRRLLATERRDLLPEDDAEWLILRGVKPLPDPIVPWPARQAKAAFLARYRVLTERAAA